MEDEEAAPVPQSRAVFVTRFVNQFQLYKKLLLKYWWIPTLCIALGLGVESWLLKQVKPTFVSAGRMIVNARLSIPNANVYNEELNNFFGTQVALMQSESVVSRVQAHLKTNSPSLQAVPVAIEVTLSPKTSIFNLRAVGESPDYVQSYLQATMEEYTKLKKDLLANTTTATQSGMEEELKEIGMELQKSKQDLLDFQSSNSVVLLQPNGGNASAEYLLSLKRQLDERNSELLLLRTETLDQNLERLQGSSGSKNSSPATNTTAQAESPQTTTVQTQGMGGTPINLGGFEAAYLQTKQQLIMKRATRDMLGKYLDPNAHEMVELNKEIPQLEMELEIDRQQSQEQLTNRMHTLELQITSLSKQVNDGEKDALDVSKKLSDFEALKENGKRLQNRYDQVQTDLQTLEVNKAIGQESVSILEPAGPSQPVPPEAQKHLVMAGLIGAILGFGVLLFISLLNDRPSTFSELEQLFDLPILGQIPLVKSGDKLTPIQQVDDTRHPLVESYRSLRSALLYKDAVRGEIKAPPKTIVISSAYPSDGKSTTSANFAITLAQGGARVLLIDADLHRGVLHDYFATAASPGLAEVFAGQCAWNETVVETPFPNLWLLPRGTAPRKAGNLFAKSGKFLADVAGAYDFCIFDSAPVMMTDDVLSLAPQADAFMLVIRAGFTSGRVAKAAMDLLRLRHVNVAGLIFNAVPPNTGDYYNYRAKEYYSYTPSAPSE
jgi:capsular exopolysaccharide synthesis family protein